MAEIKPTKIIVLCVIIGCGLLGSVTAQSTNDSELFPVSVDGRYGYVDTNGRMVIKPVFDEAFDFHDGLAGVLMGGQKKLGRDGYVFYLGGKFGYIDKTGKLAIPLAKYEFGRDFSEGLAEVLEKGCDRNHNNCSGIIDTSGNLVVKPQFSSVTKFQGGRAVVELPNGKQGMIDRTGRFVVPAIYDRVIDADEGIIIAYTFSEPPPASIFSDKLPKYKTLLLNKDGDIIARPDHTVFGPFRDGLAKGGVVVTIGSRDIEVEGVVDTTGNFLFEPKFRNIGVFGGGLAPARVAEKWGYIDKTGKFVIQPVFDSADSFVDGTAKVTIDGKTGFIDITGKMVIAPRAWEVEKFVNGHAFVTEKGYVGYIDRTGKYLWKIKFDH